MSQLKIVSWNIWGGENLKEIIKRLKVIDADVIGLQEVIRDSDRINVTKKIAEELGYKWVYETSHFPMETISEFSRDSNADKTMGLGNAIISKHEIIDTKIHLLSETRKRTAVEAVIKVNDKNLHIFSVHFVHTHLKPFKIQDTQVKSLLKVVPKENSVVVGDFNATPEQKSIQVMKNTMLDTDVKGTQLTWSTNPKGCLVCKPSGLKYKLDYIFVTKDIKIASSRAVKSTASDHLLIYSIIEI
ncbi:MAG: endonuclease/exonuclease/phosphatase family protein [Candidatus Paceibacterota bacterium]|jgi:endonuclease/exonuclease/phosphatase family metal-dependent hydrolase